MTNYHPAAEQLTAWSAGSLALSDALAITAHMETCATCRKSVERLNQVGGDLLESQTPAPASASLREQMFKRLKDKQAEPALEAAVMPDESANSPEWMPKCLKQFGVEDVNALAWKQQSGSISTYRLARDGNKRVELLRIKPGGSLSTHTHIGEETTLILTGSFSDEQGVYRAGDFMQMDERHQHSTQATSDCECICLTVQEGPVQFTGTFMRLLNPYLKWRFAASA